MAEKVYLNWTLENWITVVLMVFVGMFLIGLIASAVRTYSGTAKVSGPNMGAAPTEGY